MADYKYDVTALGELLIDFTENGTSRQGNPIYEANPGGAPCNVLSMLRNLGHDVAFIGKVGDDIFGRQLKAAVEDVGIDTTGLVTDDDVRTTLAFVKTFEDGDRDFSFYRNPGADMMLNPDDVNEDVIRGARIFHMGTLSMTHEPVRSATCKAVAVAQSVQAMISFDPNIREPLWDDMEDAKEQTAFGLSVCDILKISDNEIQWFTGEQDFDAGIKKIQDEYNIPLILLSLGKVGSRAYLKNNVTDVKAEVPAFVREDTVETTGAGDTFGGCCLHYVLEHCPEGTDINDVDWTEENLKEMLTFANKAASIITTRKGALAVMPTLEEINAQ
nr:carbohydrate kinase [uncultured Agathobacter sp.]